MKVTATNPETSAARDGDTGAAQSDTEEAAPRRPRSPGRVLRFSQRAPI